MAEDFVELGTTGIDHLVDKYWDQGYDQVRKFRGDRKSKGKDQKRDTDQKRKYRNSLPSPERERGVGAGAAGGAAAGAGYDRDDSLERESRATESVKNAYENERDDPTRRVDPALERKYRRDSARMSQYNAGYDGRARSAQPPGRGRHDDYDDDSDYEERSGRRYKTSGRGYDDDRDYPYDREVIETERYRGPAGQYQPRRMDSYGSRADPYGPGAVAQYRRSQNDVTEVSRRSRSHGRRSRYQDDDDYDDRDRSRSRSKEEGWKEKLDETFDTSMQGLGVGLAGAVVGGLAGREFGGRGQHKQRDVLLGALIGGLGANVAENKWRDWREEKKEKTERKEERWEEKWDGRDYGRSRSNVR